MALISLSEKSLDSKIITNYFAGAPDRYNLSSTDIRSIIVDSANSKAWVAGGGGGINIINLITGRIEYANTLTYKNNMATSLRSLLNQK